MVQPGDFDPLGQPFPTAQTAEKFDDAQDFFDVFDLSAQQVALPGVVSGTQAFLVPASCPPIAVASNRCQSPWVIGLASGLSTGELHQALRADGRT